MTRKQAALRAIELLSGNEENREICEALERIARDKLSQDWNRELALESIQDFIDENGYYPTAKEMDHNARMPAHASLNLAVGMCYTKVKEKYFPDVITKAEKQRGNLEEWLENFKVVFGKMGKPSEKGFNRCRSDDIPHSTTWIKRTESTSWSDMLRKCGFESDIRAERNRHCPLTVSTSESDLSDEQYDKMEKELQKLLA
ncbi:MAG: hypothetical protein NC305_13645 [Lachnospiraceae bacterium]|nr:hypothetical protein [Muribaculaceae bacterium]MCM1411576.1 hypothetical protein [Lachnospiraceae bacterium]